MALLFPTMVGALSRATGRHLIACRRWSQPWGGKVPVLVDGGFRRGMDFFKALALGADAVCIGRPYLWGLAAFGQEGVERVLDILRAELRMAMMTAGTRHIRDINRAHLGRV